MTNLRTVAQTASDLGTEVKESVADFSRTAGRKIEDARAGTGSALHTAASSVRKSSAAIDDLATGTADRLDATGSFVENYHMKDALNGLMKFGRSHLAGSLMVAAAVGFLAGSALSRGSQPRS